VLQNRDLRAIFELDEEIVAWQVDGENFLMRSIVTYSS
jgi:hypothetical protein